MLLEDDIIAENKWWQHQVFTTAGYYTPGIYFYAKVSSWRR
jgi:hypothetical protein